MLIKKRRYIALLAILILILIFKPSLITKTKIVIFETLSVPFKVIKSIFYNAKPKSFYIKENAMLKEKSALLALEVSRMSEIARENDRLRDLMDFKKQAPYKTIPAQVIGRSPSTWTESVLINKGKNHGIKKHMAACTSRGMVGSVYEVGPFTSKVMLLTDPDSRVGVVLENTRQTGILIGTNENKCRMIYLSINSEVKRGERVRTSGFGGMFPKDLEVGFVSDVKIDSIGFYKYAIVELSQDTNTIEEILCIE